jgi:hypothetical protein
MKNTEDIIPLYFSDAGISYPYDVYENKNEIIKLIKNGK